MGNLKTYPYEKSIEPKYERNIPSLHNLPHNRVRHQSSFVDMNRKLNQTLIWLKEMMKLQMGTYPQRHILDYFYMKTIQQVKTMVKQNNFS